MCHAEAGSTNAAGETKKGSERGLYTSEQSLYTTNKQRPLAVAACARVGPAQKSGDVGVPHARGKKEPSRGNGVACPKGQAGLCWGGRLLASPRTQSVRRLLRVHHAKVASHRTPYSLRPKTRPLNPISIGAVKPSEWSPPHPCLKKLCWARPNRSSTRTARFGAAQEPLWELPQGSWAPAQRGVRGPPRHRRPKSLFGSYPF